MIGLLLTLALAQTPCSDAEARQVREASALAEALDLAGAADRLRIAAGRGCATADVGAWYLRGILDARDAFRLGAPPESLEPVRRAIAALEALAAGQSGPAEIARLLLNAAAAGAQSERAEMRLFLDTAAQMESLQRAAGQPGVPIVSSLELAGDLWLQLFNYREARDAYMQAAGQGNTTTRTLAGLARTAARLDMDAAACMEYRRLLERWSSAAPAIPPEIAEARVYVRRPACQPSSP